MVFSQIEHSYQRLVFQPLKQIVPLLRWITLSAVHVQIGNFLYKTDKTSLSKTSVMLSITSFTAIVSTGLLCFFFCDVLLFLYRSFTFCLFSQWAWQLFNLIFIIFTALPFFLFSMFFMFMGVFHVFLFYGFNVFQCLYVLMY